ncbi:elongation of very long chain fatty acids protein AAEL008004-like [Venturia canescens]|uniref:elongation of very long chain fatty acids protein AAEL008004-like n=1 Tax=Venturia canescens TaxID=32260 RepID=UPI001C9D59A3|nr:elongation of very long chain fatty acids protein AAEL008004-like [Venturia canescens]
MATIIKALLRGYHYMNDEISDPRTSNWFLIGSPWPGALIIFSYLYFVQVCGPRWMINKKPYNLYSIMQIYNVVQIALSAYLLYKALELGWLGYYNFTCEPVDYSMNPRSLEIASTVWLYFIVKIIDLLDTVFFVLRKKQNQVSFLHVYHHAGMVFGGWAAVKYLPGGHVTFLGLINSFVHVVMYTHYLVTSLKIGKPWWKKYVTQLQLAQFILVLYHFAQLLWIPDCGFPKWPAAIFIPQNLFMIVLFSDFYYKTYIKKRPHGFKEHNHENGVKESPTNGKSKIQ